MRSKMLLVTFVVFGTMLVASAFAAAPRQAATDEYGSTPVIGATSTSTAPTAADAPAVTGSTAPTTATTPDATDAPTDTDVAPPTTTSTDATAPGRRPSKHGGKRTSNPTAVGAPGAAGAAGGTGAEPVEHIDFGRADKLPLHKPFKQLREDVVGAEALTPYTEDLFGGATNKQFNALSASPLMRLLSAVAVKLSGQAWGAQMVNVTPLAQQVFPVLLGSHERFVSLKRVVLTRRAELPKGEAAFMDGVALGIKSAGIPVAYAERTDAKKSFVKHFEKLGILTVKDVDTKAGKVRLARILTGQITTQDAVDAIKVDPASATIVDSNGSAGATPWLLLVLVLGGAGFAASGVVRHRRPRSRTSA